MHGPERWGHPRERVGLPRGQFLGPEFPITMTTPLSRDGLYEQSCLSPALAHALWKPEGQASDPSAIMKSRATRLVA